MRVDSNIESFETRSQSLAAAKWAGGAGAQVTGKSEGLGRLVDRLGGAKDWPPLTMSKRGWCWWSERVN